MNGKDKERSFSEVGDTLRYFNSMASSHSWCCTDYDEPAMALMGLNQLDMPIDGAAMATAAAKAIAVAAAVSCENFTGSDRIFPRPYDYANSRPHLLSPPVSGSPIHKPSILLTTPSQLECSQSIISNEETMDPFQIRRASDDCRYYKTPVNKRLQVDGGGVNVIDNPFIDYNRDKETFSDGVKALRADRERQRRHSTCPTSNRYQIGQKTLKSLFPRNLGHNPIESNSLESSVLGLEKFHSSRPAGAAQVGPSLVPEVVVSHHSSENLEVNEEDYLRREMAHRDQMQKNVQKYLLLTPSTPLKDKLFTAGLLALTMCGILVLFWYQNFGAGFRAFHST